MYAIRSYYDGLEDVLVGGEVELVGFEGTLDSIKDGGFEENGAENRFLDIDIVQIVHVQRFREIGAVKMPVKK